MTDEVLTMGYLETLGPVRAAALFLERLEHEETGEDDVFSRWLGASEANRIAWDRALDLWDSFDEEDDALFADMRRDALVFRPRRPAVSWIGYAAAASVVLAVAVTAALNLGGLGEQQAATQVAAAGRPDLRSFGLPDYTTAVGQRATYVLGDGSRLTLDTNTAIDVAFVDGSRLARLVRGQAFFDVAHNPARPFRVAAGENVVSVLGTRFNIRLDAKETRVLLVQGAIGVSEGRDPVHPGAEVARLLPGQQLIARTGQANEIRAVAVDPGLEWKRGFVQFDGQTLGAAIEEMNRYTSQQLVVRDPKVAALRVSGAFPADDTESFVQALTALYPVRATPMAGGKREIVAK